MRFKPVRRIFPWRPLWWQFMRSRHDFLLRVSPNSHYKYKEYAQSTYPPPGYGLPPGNRNTSPQKAFQPKHQYALFLFPGKLVQYFLWFSLLLPPFIFLPLLNQTITLPVKDISISAYIVSICTFWLISYLFYLFLYRYFIPPVLSRVWEKWPTPANHLFLSVPHHVCVYEKHSKEDENIYWQPDKQSPLYRQTSESAPDTQNLQEVLLNFAVFDFFFKRPQAQPKDQENNDTHAASHPESNLQPVINMLAGNLDKTIKENHWFFYLFTPIWLNYGLIVLSLLILTFWPTVIPSTKYALQCAEAALTWSPGANLPYNFISVILTWLFLSFIYMKKIIGSLEKMHRQIRQGTLDAHLELVPQPILKELTNIPAPQHIDSGIQHIKRTMGVISSVGLVAFLGIIEIFSQAYGSSPDCF